MDIWTKAVSLLPYAAIIASVALGLALFGRVIFRLLSRPTGDPLGAEGAVRVAEAQETALVTPDELGEEWPKCPCGARATHPAPKLVRDRTGWVRSYFAGAPTYKRQVPKTSHLWGLVQKPFPIEQYVYCETHAHVADAEMDRFIYERIRAVQAEANERIAVEAAEFEETLRQRVQRAIEPKKQQKQLPEAQPLRLLSTGTR